MHFPSIIIFGHFRNQSILIRALQSEDFLFSFMSLETLNDKTSAPRMIDQRALQNPSMKFPLYHEELVLEFANKTKSIALIFIVTLKFVFDYPQSKTILLFNSFQIGDYSSSTTVDGQTEIRLVKMEIFRIEGCNQHFV